MDALHSHYDLTIEVLTPLHIGTGTELIRDYDFAVRSNRTWVIHQEHLLAEALSEDGSFDNALLTSTAASLLRADDFRADSPLFRYSMPGAPTNRPLREQIKTVWGEPYLPGSSVKGMLRTLLLWGLYTHKNRALDLSALGNSRSWAAQGLEGAMLAPLAGRSDRPNKDIFKALLVRDSSPVPGAESLMIVSANIYPTSSGRQGPRDRGAKPQGVNVDAEAIRPGSQFHTEISLDEYGFRNSAALRILGWDGLRVWFNRLVKIGQAHSQQRLVEEYEWHKAKGPEPAASFYGRLLNGLDGLGNVSWYAQIGWGTGWRAGTLNDLLTKHPQFAGRVIQAYRLGKGTYTGPEFPKSRKLLLREGQAHMPMGWVKCTLRPRS